MFADNMDLCAELKRVVEEMDFEEVLSTLREMIDHFSAPSPLPPLAPPPLVVPAGLNTQTQLSAGNDGCTLLEAAPSSFEQLGHLYNEAGAYNQEFNIHPQLGESLSGGYNGSAPHSFDQPSQLMTNIPGLNVGQATHISCQYQQNVMQPGHLYSQAGVHHRQQFNIQPQLVSGGYNGSILQETAPNSFGQPCPLMAAPGLNGGQSASFNYQYSQTVTQQCHLHSQAAVSKGQNLPYFNPVQSAATASYTAAPLQPCNHVPMMSFPENKTKDQGFLGLLNGALVYVVPAPAPSIPAALPQQCNNVPVLQNRTGMTQNLHPVGLLKRKCKDEQDDQPYIKKPPNAFMLFMKEQRQNVVAELGNGGTGSARVNTLLGERWNSLSNEEQSKYYKEAHTARRLHNQLYPNWSPKSNHGKKRKRERSSSAKMDEASASSSGELTQQNKKPCLTQKQTCVMEASTS